MMEKTQSKFCCWDKNERRILIMLLIGRNAATLCKLQSRPLRLQIKTTLRLCKATMLHRQLCITSLWKKHRRCGIVADMLSRTSSIRKGIWWEIKRKVRGKTNTLKRNWTGGIGDGEGLREFAGKRIFYLLESRLRRALDEKWFKKQQGSPSGVQWLLFWCEGRRKKEKNTPRHHLAPLADRNCSCVSTLGPLLKRASVTRYRGGGRLARKLHMRQCDADDRVDSSNKLSRHMVGLEIKQRLWQYRVWVACWQEIEKKGKKEEAEGWRNDEMKSEGGKRRDSFWVIKQFSL